MPLPGRPRDARILNEYVVCAPISVLDRKLPAGDMVHVKRGGRHVIRTVVRTPESLMLRHAGRTIFSAGFIPTIARPSKHVSAHSTQTTLRMR